jgi:hypothetical protein
MLNENAQKWVAALRSGEFHQDKAQLQTANGYCCLGVACEVYQREVGGLEIRRPSWEEGVSYNDEFSSLPDVVKVWLGLQYADGDFTTSDSDNQTLADLNDLGTSFDQIADIIESCPLELFC